MTFQLGKSSSTNNYRHKPCDVNQITAA